MIFKHIEISFHVLKDMKTATVRNNLQVHSPYNPIVNTQSVFSFNKGRVFAWRPLLNYIGQTRLNKSQDALKLTDFFNTVD